MRKISSSSSRGVLLLSAILVCLIVGISARAAERVALVIGNTDYDVGRLTNPGNDADGVAAALERLGFSVVKRKDLGLDQMEDAVLKFNRSLSDGSVAWFYFAGHGLQVKGENFLVPIDARIREEYEARRECLHVASLLDAMESSRSRLNVIVWTAAATIRTSGVGRGAAAATGWPRSVRFPTAR